MTQLIQIRNVPDGVHAELKARAKREGKSLNSYMLEVVTRAAQRPGNAEVFARILATGPVGRSGGRSSAELIRRAREQRQRQLLEAIGLDPELARDPLRDTPADGCS